MTNWIEHPIRSFLDWVAIGGRPSSADYDRVVGRCVDEQSEVSPAELRRELVSASKRIITAHGAGNSGQARTIARETTIVLGSALGELPPPPSKDAGKTTREIVESLPRGTF